jgi:hypothetical protein
LNYFQSHQGRVTAFDEEQTEQSQQNVGHGSCSVGDGLSDFGDLFGNASGLRDCGFDSDSGEVVAVLVDDCAWRKRKGKGVFVQRDRIAQSCELDQKSS